jgi:serine/threonine protein kinase
MDPTGAFEAIWTRQVECWLGGRPVLLERLLEEHPVFQSDPRVLDLICNEYHLRQSVGDMPDAESYMQRFPAFSGGLRLRLCVKAPVVGPAPGQAAAPAAGGQPPTVIDRPRSELASTGAWATLPPPAHDAASPGEPPALTIPGYEVLAELGRGGMGIVYKARHLALDRLVALKIMHGGTQISRGQLARFRAEAQAVAQLKHPNLVQVYDINEHDGLAYLSLELVEGDTLEQQLDATPQPPRQAASLVETLARAIHSAHQKHIVHRDLKPGNVLRTRDGIPKIADFGLASRVVRLEPTAGRELQPGQASPRTGPIVGTPSYMAPEQAEGRDADIGPATDVYALGAILYEALTGRPPFKAATPADTLNEVRTTEPVPPSQLRPKCPRDLETICLKCLAKSPHRRYASALELADDLRRYEHGEPIRARAVGRVERAWRWCCRNPVAACLLVVVTLGSAFGMVHLSQLSRDLVRSSALESASHQAEMFEEMNNFYSKEVVDRVRAHGVKASAHYRTESGTIPVPATLTIDLGDHISANSRLGMRVRLYSDMPFRSRKDGGPRDDFERDALARLHQDPETPVYRFEDSDGHPTLRYAQARRMAESCVACHNSHPDSPKKDWKVGDVRGVVEVIRPLDNDARRTAAGLRGTFYLTAAASGVFFVLAGLVLYFANPRRRRAAAERAAL